MPHRCQSGVSVLRSIALLIYTVASVRAENLALYLVARAGDDGGDGKHGLTSADQNSTSANSTTFIPPSPPDDKDNGTVAKVKATATDFMDTTYGVLQGKWIILIVAIVVGLFVIMVVAACVLRHNRKKKLAEEMEKIHEMERASGQDNMFPGEERRQEYGVV